MLMYSGTGTPAGGAAKTGTSLVVCWCAILRPGDATSKPVHAENRVKMTEITEFPHNYVVCGAFAAVAGAGVLYRVLRPKFSIKVNCWFCNRDSVVPYGNRNCWDCMHCDQYNGFREDGDYNKPIPSQYTEEFNHPISPKQREPSRSKSDILCAECSRNQLLKISQLANFVPMSEAHFGQEIELFKQNLEHIYRLCPDCERRANRRIEKVDQRVEKKYGIQRPQTPTSSHDVSSLSDRLTVSSCSDHHLLCHLRAPFHIRLLRFMTVLCAAVLFIVDLHNLQTDAKTVYIKFPKRSIHYIELIYKSMSPLLVFGPLTAVAAMFLHGPARLVSADILHLMFWMIPCLLQTKLIPFKREDKFLLQTLCAFFMLVMATWCWLCSRADNQRSPRRIGKKRLRKSPASSTVTNSQISQNSDTKSASHFSNHATFCQGHPTDPLNKLGTMTLGPPAQTKRKASSVFKTGNSQVTSTTNPLMSSLSRHAQKRPLISPARFKGHQSSHSPASLQKSASWPPKVLPQRRPSWLDSSNFPSESVSCGDSQSQCGDQHSDGSTSSNSSSSVCPVGTTTSCQYADDDREKKSSAKLIIREYLLAFSLAANILIVTFLALNWNRVQSYFSSE